MISAAESVKYSPTPNPGSGGNGFRLDFSCMAPFLPITPVDGEEFNYEIEDDRPLLTTSYIVSYPKAPKIQPLHDYLSLYDRCTLRHLRLMTSMPTLEERRKEHY